MKIKLVAGDAVRSRVTLSFSPPGRTRRLDNLAELQRNGIHSFCFYGSYLPQGHIWQTRNIWKY